MADGIFDITPGSGDNRANVPVNLTVPSVSVTAGPSVLAQPPPPPPPAPPAQRKNILRTLKIIGVVLLLLLLFGGAGFVISSFSKNSSQDSDQYQNIKIPLQDLSKTEPFILGTKSLAINGQLQLNDSFIISPSAQPSKATAGQIYYDQTNNQLAYYNGTKFVPITEAASGSVINIGGQSGQIAVGDGLAASNGEIRNTGVLSLQGQTGNVTLTAGDGIAINGTALSNSGIISAASGSSNITVTNDGSGNITISSTGAGTGTVASPGGTAGRIAKFTGVQTVENSLLSESGSVVTVSGDLSVTGTLSLGSALSVGNGGTGATSLANNGVVIGQGAGALTAVTAAGSGLCFMSTVGAPAFSACPGGGGGVTSLNSLTGALTVANASGVGSTITIDNASTTAKGIAQFDSTNFTVVSGAVDTIQDIAVGSTPTFGGITISGLASLNGGASVTGTLNANTITPTGAMAVGATTQSLLLQGNSSTSVAATNAGNTTTVNFQAPTANVTYRFLTTAAGTYDICTTVGNCAGVGGGVTTAGGTTNQLAKFTGAQAIGDSIISDNGTTVTIAGTLAVNTVTPTSALTVGATGQNLNLQGAVVNLTATNGGITNALTFATPSGSNKTITVPNATGTVAVSASGPITLDANGNIACPTCGISGSGVTSLNGLTGGLTIANASGVGSTITIDDATTGAKGIASFNGTNFSVASGAVNTIQNINTGASPTFTGLTLSGDLAVNGGDITSTGALNITPSGALVAGSTSQTLTLQGNASTTLTATNAGNTSTVAFQSPTANVTYRFATAAAGTYDICTTVGNCSGAAATLQSAYNASTNPEIVVDATRGGLTVRDAATPIAANLLEVQDNAGTTTYLAVTTAGASVVGNFSATGVITGGTASLAGSLVLHDGSSNTATLQTAALAQNTIYTIPDPGGGAATICLSTGNCAGAGNGVTGTGTTNRLPKFTAATTVADSTITDNGTTVSTTVDLVIQGGDATIGVAASQTGTLNFAHSGSSFLGSIVQGALTANRTYTLPDVDGTFCTTAGNCSGGGSTNTLQAAYDAGSTITTTDARDIVITLADTATDSNFSITTATGSSSFVSVARADGAGTADPAQLLLVDNLDTNRAQPIGLKVQSAAGGITTGIDASDAEIVDAISVGANNIVGTTGNLDFTNFDVVGASGNTTIGGTLGVTGTSTFNGIANFNTDMNAILTDAENFEINSTVTGVTTLNLFNATMINNSTGGVQGVAWIENGAGTANTSTLLSLANTDTDNLVLTGLYIYSDTGSITTAIDASDPEVGTALNIGANPIVGTTANIDLTNFDVVGASGNTTIGGTLGVTGNTTLTGDLAVNGGDITSTGALNITPGGSLVVGATGQNLTLQGNASASLTSTNGANTTTVNFQAATANVTYRFATAAAGTYDICTTVGNCSGTAATLQSAYDAGNTITTTNARNIAFSLADTATDSNFAITTATDSTGFTSLARADGAGTADPAQLLLIDNLDTDRAQPIGLKIQSAAGGMTTGIDASDAELVDALSIGANNIVGTTGTIDFSNFDVSSAGAVTAVGVNSGTGLITGTGGLTVTGATNINVNTNSATNINTGTSNSLVSVGGGAGTFALDTTNIDISNTGAISGATGLALTSGNISQAGAGTVSTGTGAVSLNGDTAIASNKSFTANGTALFKSATNSASAFLIQNAAGANVFSVSTLDTNFILNPSAEVAFGGEWATYGTGTTVTRDTTTAWNGVASVKVDTTGSAASGVKNNLGAGLATSTVHYVSFYAKLGSGSFTDITVTYSPDGAATVACGTYNSRVVSLTGWSYITCDFNSGGTATNASAFLAISQAAGATRTFYVDGVELGTAHRFNGASNIALDGVITSPVGLQNTENSRNAFSVMNVAGDSLFSVDSDNGRVVIGADKDFTGAKARLYFGDNFTASNPWIGEAPGGDNDILQLQGRKGISLSVGDGSIDVLTIVSNGSGNTGDVTIKNPVAGGSATALQVQNQAGRNILGVDTTSGSAKVLFGNITAAAGQGVAGVLTLADGTNDNFGATLNTTTLTANRTITLPDEGGTVCLQNSSSCGFLTGSGAATLQGSYNGGNTIATTNARDIGFTLADTATDGNFTITTATGSTGTTTLARADGAGTADPAQLLLIDNLDTDRAQPIGLKLQSAAGAMTTAIDASDAEIVDAINVGGNNIVGTTGNIDLTNFDVVGASGNTTVGGTLGVTGAATFSSTVTATGLINSTGGALQTNSTTRVDNSGNLTNIGNITATGATTIASTGAGNDITIDGADQFIIQDAAVFNGTGTFNSDVDVTLADTENVNITDTVTGSNSVILFNVAMTNNASSGLQGVARFENAGGTGATLTLLNLHNADADNPVLVGLHVTAEAGGILIGVDASDSDIVDAINVGANNIVGTTGNIDLTNFDVVGASGNTTIGGTLGVTGNTTLTGDLAVNGGDITSTGALNITPGGSLVVGATGQSLTLQGNSSTSLTSTNGANTTTVNFQAATANVTYRFATAAAGTYDICTSVGNCSGVGATLQGAYDGGNTIATTDARDLAITLSDTATDANLTVTTATGGTGFTTFARADGAGTADPAQLLLIDNLDTNRIQPIGLKLQAAAGGMTTAIDATDAEIVDAINVGANNIVGTTGNLDFTNFDVVGASGNTTVGGTGTFTVTSGLTSLTGNTTGDALNVSNSTSTGNIALFKDNATNVFTIADGGAATFQNETNSATGFRILQSNNTRVFTVDVAAAAISIGDVAPTGGAKLLISAGPVGLRVNATSTNNSIEAQNAGTTVFSVTQTGGIIIRDGTNNDVTTGTNEDLTLLANGTGIINLNDATTIAGTATLNGDLVANGTNITFGDAATDLLTFTGTIQGASPLVFEGGTADASELTLAIATLSGDQTITLPNETGTVCTNASGSTTCSGNYILNSSSLQNPGNFNIISAAAGSIAARIEGAASQTAAVLLVKGGSSPTGNTFEVQNSAGIVAFSVDTGNTRTTVGSGASCTGRLCVSQSITGGGGGTSTNLYNHVTASVSGAITLNAQHVIVDDTSTAIASTLNGLIIDTSGSTNTAATVNTFFADIRSGAPGTFLQLQNGTTNVFTTTNAGATTLQNTTDSTGAFQVLLSPGNGGTPVFTVDTANDSVLVNAASLGGGAPAFYVQGTTGSQAVARFQSGAVSATANVLELQDGNGADRLTVGPGHYTNTSSTLTYLNVAPNFAPTATSTATFIAQQIAPIINFSNGTPGAGNTTALLIKPTYTAAPTGTNLLLDAQNGATSVFNIGRTGVSVQKTTTDSTTAFQFQNSSSVNVLSVDTTNGRVLVGPAAGDTSGALLVLGKKTDAGDPTGTQGAMYYNVAMHQYRCFRGVNATDAQGAWEPCGTNPIDEGFMVQDEFMTGAPNVASAASPGTGGHGEAGWNAITIGASNCTAMTYNQAAAAPTADRPGVLRMNTAASSGTGCTLYLGSTTAGSTVPAVGNVFKAAVAVGDTSNPLMRVGIGNQTTGLSSTAGVWWEADPSSSSTWRYCYGNATPAAVCANSGTSIAANTFVRLEARITALGSGTSSAEFFINGTRTTVSGITINTNRVSPFVGCSTSVGTAVNCYTDYYQVRGYASAAR